MPTTPKTPKRSLTDDELPEVKKQAGRIVRVLKRTYPDAECALVHDNPYQLLVAVILSAQCTDERVNRTTPALFARYPDPLKLSRARQPTVEKLLGSVNYYRTKAKNIRAMAKALVTEHDGEVPQTVDELTALAGVGRKTANVVLGVAFGVPTGVVVDTHVKRISGLLGLTRSDKPEVIEHDLAAVLPKREWIDYSHRIIDHGRAICIARRPKCKECPLLKNCPRVGLPPLSEE